MTDAEKRLWSRLRRRTVMGYRFRRQVPIGRYIADFVCMSAHLVVELDGGQHNEPQNELMDATRTAWLEGQGYRVVRFWNSDVFAETDSVVDTILNALEDQTAVDRECCSAPPTLTLPAIGGDAALRPPP